MKSKTLNFIIASVFAFVFLIGFASAVTISGTPSTLSQDGGSFIISVSSTETNDQITLSIDNSHSDIDFDINETSFTLNEDSRGINITYDTNDFDFEFLRDYSVTLEAESTNSSNDSVVLKFADSDFCSGVENPGNLDIEIDEINVVEKKDGLISFGDDEDWFPLDRIELVIVVQNDGSEDIDDIDLEWGLYDESNNEWAIEVDDVENFDLKDDDEETFTISFTISESDLDVDLEDLEDGTYRIYVKATGEVDDDSNPKTCDSDSADATIIIEDDFVIIDDVELPEVVQCDSNVQISGDVWNIGDDDQDEVTVVITNSKLGINEILEIGDIDSFDSESFDTTFTLPEVVEEGTYYLQISVYDEDDEIYENDFDDEKASFIVPLKVEGNCALASASVSAVLQEGGQAGKPLVIKATIINTGKKQTTYTINAAGYSEWANSYEASQTSVVLGAGATQDVLLTFDVKEDIEGTFSFNIELLSQNKLVLNQPVADVTIEKRSGLNWFTGDSILGENKGYIWGIGILNLILIVVIVIVAIRIARK